jgi:hypothetical protein
MSDHENGSGALARTGRIPSGPSSREPATRLATGAANRSWTQTCGSALLTIAILAAPGLGAPSAGANPLAENDAALSALLKKQTEAFSIAGQRGDAATLGFYLDPDVVFTNETGEIATRAELIDGVAPVADPPQIETTNWNLRRQGDVATATFVDVVTRKFHGHTLVYRFQSTETWAKRAAGWKMIASHTMVVPTPPPAVKLTSEELDQYVGSYRVDSTLVVRIVRTPDGLSAVTNDDPPVALLAETRDVFFTPSAPAARRIFRRNAAGEVTGYVSRRNGADVEFQKEG